MSKIINHLPSGCFKIEKDFLPSNWAQRYLIFGKIFGRKIEKSKNLCDQRKFLSKNHNLLTDEQYYKVAFSGVQGQHFESYGHQGHKLTYFTGTQNIPKNLQKILQFYFVGEDEYDMKKINFTFNQYQPNFDHDFPFHKDIPSNGETTIIYSVGAPATFELSNGVSVDVPHNSLIELKSVARWELLHRVTSRANLLPRYSFVFGLNKQN